MNSPNGTLQDYKTLTVEDKALNMYCLSKKQYLNLLQNAITSKYKKTHKHTATNVNNEGVKYAKETNSIDRIEINAQSNSFITLNTIKKNFLICPTTRLLNSQKIKLVEQANRKSILHYNNKPQV